MDNSALKFSKLEDVLTKCKAVQTAISEAMAHGLTVFYIIDMISDQQQEDGSFLYMRHAILKDSFHKNDYEKLGFRTEVKKYIRSSPETLSTELIYSCPDIESCMLIGRMYDKDFMRLKKESKNEDHRWVLDQTRIHATRLLKKHREEI